ncbi:MAG: hypothetical protein R3B90_04680 [Planctomycetaceae bacterium]
MAVLIEHVVGHLVHEVMQPDQIGAADVHGGPMANPFDPFEMLDFVSAVIWLGLVVGFDIVCNFLGKNAN